MSGVPGGWPWFNCDSVPLYVSTLCVVLSVFLTTTLPPLSMPKVFGRYMHSFCSTATSAGVGSFPLMLPGARRTSTSVSSPFLPAITSLYFIICLAQTGSPLRSTMSAMAGTLPVTVTVPVMTPLPLGAGGAAGAADGVAAGGGAAADAVAAGLSSPLSSGQPVRAVVPSAIIATAHTNLDMVFLRSDGSGASLGETGGLVQTSRAH